MTSDPAADDPRHALKRHLAAIVANYRAELGAGAPDALRCDVNELLGAATLAPAAARGGGAAPAESVDEVIARFPRILGRSRKLLDVFRLVLKVAPTDATVLVQGESGTGKELIARAIHDLSARRQGPYVAENCAAFPETLLESELFGHSKGAFTGADRQRKGRFQMADKGTLFLDEVGDMSAALQKKLLRALQEGEIRAVGSSTSIRIDVRFLSASNKDLADLVTRGLFREDLYYRLSPIKVELPPLRERGDDLLLLLDRLAADAARRCGRPEPPAFAPEAIEAMRRYRWPGNVRELQNEVQRMIALADPGRPIGLRDLSEEIRAAARA